MNVTKFSPYSIAQLRSFLVSELRQWLLSEFEGAKLRQLNFDEHTGPYLCLCTIDVNCYISVYIDDWNKLFN